MGVEIFRMKHLVKKTTYILITLICLELGLRLLGHAPFSPTLNRNLKFIEADSLKGWIHVPGNYQFVVNHWGDTMNFTINKERNRITKTNPMSDKSEKILLIGGSFIMGMGLNDEQTLGWKLQQKFPDIDIKNLGVGAYGTYQSLLVLKEQLKQSKKPKAIIYGLISHHRFRNIAQSDWLFSLAINEKRSNTEIILPYVAVGANEKLIGKNENVRLPKVPFAEKLAIGFVIQRAIHKIKRFGRADAADKVLELLLLEMQRLCKEANIPFYVNVLYSEKPFMLKLVSFFEQNDMAYIDCNVPLNETNIFRNDGHPKEIVNEEWAKRTSKRMLQDGIVMDDH